MYKCSDCDYTSPKYFGLCPNCKSGVGEEIKEQSSNGQINIKNIDIKKVSKDVKNTIMESVFMTNFQQLNSILSVSGGCVADQVVLIGAVSGVGKSTLCSGIANKDTLYISTEESYPQVNNRMLRVNPNSDCDIFSSVNFDEILSAIEQTEKKIIIIDSLNCINNGESYAKQANNMVKITSLCKAKHKICFITSHVTKGGDITGMSTIIHAVDTVLYLENSLVGNNIVLYSTKNRFNEVGDIDIMKQTQNGLIEIVDDKDENIENGCTIAEIRFGHKNVRVKIEALVAPASNSFGIRSASGLNQRRLNQIIGILSYYMKDISWGAKDIYIGTRNGVVVDDSNTDLSIVNSILSSIKGKNIYPELQGEVSLTGSVINCKDIKHITEIINAYR